MPERVARTASKDINAIGSPGNGRWVTGDLTAWRRPQRVPAPLPCRAVPGLVPELAIGTFRDEIDAIRTPGRGVGRRRHVSAEALPASPTVVPPVVPDGVVSASDELVDAIRAPGHGGGI